MFYRFLVVLAMYSFLAIPPCQADEASNGAQHSTGAAGLLQRVDALSRATPIGSIAAYFGSTEPEGWLLCDGRPLDDHSIDAPKFDKLKALLKGEGIETLPDFRGVFLRGRDNFGTPRGNAKRDPDGERAPGHYQEDSFQGHKHQYWGDGGNYLTRNDGGSNVVFITGEHAQYSVQADPRNDYGDPRPSVETRPKNVAVNYLIKY